MKTGFFFFGWVFCFASFRKWATHKVPFVLPLFTWSWSGMKWSKMGCCRSWWNQWILEYQDVSPSGYLHLRKEIWKKKSRLKVQAWYFYILCNKEISYLHAEDMPVLWLGVRVSSKALREVSGAEALSFSLISVPTHTLPQDASRKLDLQMWAFGLRLFVCPENLGLYQKYLGSVSEYFTTTPRKISGNRGKKIYPKIKWIKILVLQIENLSF